MTASRILSAIPSHKEVGDSGILIAIASAFCTTQPRILVIIIHHVINLGDCSINYLPCEIDWSRFTRSRWRVHTCNYRSDSFLASFGRLGFNLVDRSDRLGQLSTSGPPHFGSPLLILSRRSSTTKAAERQQVSFARKKRDVAYAQFHRNLNKSWWGLEHT